MVATPTKTQLVFPETEAVEQKLATLRLTGAPAPLQLGNSLDGLEKSDSTPLIGTEFARGVQIKDLFKAPNADELIKDLAVLSAYIVSCKIPWTRLIEYISLPAWCCLLPRPRSQHRRAEAAGHEARRAQRQTRVVQAARSPHH